MDPFSVTGSAVGVTSLGLQVCQALVRYYAQFRGFHHDVDAVVNRVESLEGTLRLLESMMHHSEFKNNNGITQLQEAISATRQSVNNLQKQVDYCCRTRMPASFRDRAKLVRKRLLWPFRQDTLASLEKTLDRTQSQLMLVLQVLGMKVEYDGVEGPRTATSAVVAQRKLVGDEERNKSSAPRSIGNDVQTLSASQKAGPKVLNSQMAALFNQSAKVSLQLSTIEEKVNLIISSGGDALQLNSSSTSDESRNATNFRLRKQQNPRKIRNQQRIMHRSDCNCHFYLRKSESMTYGGCRWFSFPVFVVEMSEHLQSCPHFARGDYSRTVEAGFVITCTRTIKYCVRAGWLHTRASGWTAISPVLRSRHVVSRRSPAFRPFLLLLSKASIYSSEMRKKDLKRELYEALSDVRDSFRAHTASPFDVLDGALESGLGISAFAVWLSVQFFRYGALNSNEVITFLDDLEREGVPFHGRDDRGMNYFCTSQSILFPTRIDAKHADAFEIYSHIIRKTRSWSVPPLPSRSQALFEAAYRLLSIENFFNDFEEESSLVLAVLQRSEPDLAYLLSLQPPPDFHTSLEFEQALCYAVSWPAGLEMILSSIPSPSVSLKWGGSYVFYDALGCGNEESVRLLIRKGIVLGHHAWLVACRWQCNFSTQVQQEIFTYIATGLAEQSIPEDFAPYYDLLITPIAAEALWEAGFRNFDITKSHDSALWFHGIDDFLSVAKVALIEWFISKGAHITWINPRTQTTPAHAIAHTLARGKIASEQKSITLSNGSHMGDDVPFVMDILLREQRDLCICPCSAGGCRPIGCLIKKSNCTTLWKTGCSPDWVREKRRQRFLLDPVYTMINEHRNMRWIASTILRILTFEELHLTHTCCYRMDEEDTGWFIRPSEVEREEIRYAEGQDIELLEMLMQEFEIQWEAFKDTFEIFVDTVWRTRMDDVLISGDMDEDQLHKIREIGVLLTDVGCE